MRTATWRFEKMKTCTIKEIGKKMGMSITTASTLLWQFGIHPVGERRDGKPGVMSNLYSVEDASIIIAWQDAYRRLDSAPMVLPALPRLISAGELAFVLDVSQGEGKALAKKVGLRSVMCKKRLFWEINRDDWARLVDAEIEDDAK